ncbi:hypothetical protein Brsp06_01370 [Brucella sp. NBRC 13694]|jgi:hypothetical protein|nr:hypothetical protein DR92_328 [Brucella anthropi]MBA8859919.1 hypothetical protein [Brucella anthropi]NIH75912.1 hypothetical protein [Ochrobactrum sp. P20RRXII]SUA67950.1 Uncharacterised protein [Brucella anthropi]
MCVWKPVRYLDKHREKRIVKPIGTAHGTLGRGLGGLLNGEKYG